MSVIAQFGVVDALVGIQILVVFALIALFRRVARLERGAEAPAGEVDPLDGHRSVPDEAPGPNNDDVDDDEYGIPFWQHPSAGTPARPAKPQSGAAVPIEAKERRASTSFDREVAAYNALASHFSQTDFDAFEQRWHPEPIAHSADNGLVDDPRGDFWLIRTGVAGDPHGLIVPGPDIVRKWELYYRSMGSMAAKTLLEGLYEIGDDAPLRLEQPAIATLTDTGWEVEVPGTFADG